MAFLGDNYSADELGTAGDGDFSPLPDGWYQCDIAGAELKTANSGGTYLAIKYRVDGPTHTGRVIWGNITLRNANADAERIGRGQLGDLIRACGLASIQDSDELIGRTVEVRVATKKRDGFEPKSEPKAYRAVGGGSSAPAPTAPRGFAAPDPAQTSTTAQQPSTAGPTNRTAPPWARRG